MAALQHALPVVGTVTVRSDRVLRDSDAIVAIAVDAVDESARATERLASDREERLRRGLAARALFEREFAWDRIAARLLRELE